MPGEAASAEPNDTVDSLLTGVDPDWKGLALQDADG
jgi:hypothetical protein